MGVLPSTERRAASIKTTCRVTGPGGPFSNALDQTTGPVTIGEGVGDYLAFPALLIDTRFFRAVYFKTARTDSFRRRCFSVEFRSFCSELRRNTSFCCFVPVDEP